MPAVLRGPSKRQLENKKSRKSDAVKEPEDEQFNEPPRSSNVPRTSQSSSHQQGVSPQSGSFAATIKKEYGIVLGSRVYSNALFSLYQARVAGELSGSEKFFKVYSISGWPEEHADRVREMYTKKKFFNVKGSPKILKVIDDDKNLFILQDSHSISLADHVAALRRQSLSHKHWEALFATWYVQILRSMSRAADVGIYFERLNPNHIFFLNHKDHVIIADFTGATYVDAKSESGFVRCRNDIVESMITPPEIEKFSTGDGFIEEDALVSGEIWLAGAAIYNLVTNGKFPEYEPQADGRFKLVIQTSMGPPYSNDMRRFLKEVLDWEPEYRPKDHHAAVEHDWIIKNRREAMVPSIQSMRNGYQQFMEHNRGGLNRKVTNEDLNKERRNFEMKNKQSRRILAQEDHDLKEGCQESFEAGNLQKQFISGYGWALTKYEKSILDGSYTGLLPSRVLNRKPIASQQIKRVYERFSNDFHSLTLYSDDYSEMPDQIGEHMQGVLSEVPPPKYSDASSSANAQFFSSQSGINRTSLTGDEKGVEENFYINNVGNASSDSYRLGQHKDRTEDEEDYDYDSRSKVASRYTGIEEVNFGSTTEDESSTTNSDKTNRTPGLPKRRK